MALNMRGTVVEFDSDCQFGFVRPDGHIKQVLVRRDALRAAGYVGLAAGERVEITVDFDDRYIPVAVGITRFTDTSPRQRKRAPDAATGRDGLSPCA